MYPREAGKFKFLFHQIELFEMDYLSFLFLSDLRLNFHSNLKQFIIRTVNSFKHSGGYNHYSRTGWIITRVIPDFIIYLKKT
jgi:hypothetical protein